MPFSFWVIFISTYRACFSILLMPFSFWEQFSGVLCLFFHSYHATLFLRAIFRSITIVFRMDWRHYQRWRDFHESTMKRFSRVSFLFSEWTDDTINDKEIFTSIVLVFRMDWRHYQRWRDFHEHRACFQNGLTTLSTIKRFLRASLLFTEWTDDIINDEEIFPPRDDVPFPKNFRDTCSKIFRFKHLCTWI